MVQMKNQEHLKWFVWQFPYLPHHQMAKLYSKEDM
jgi:hypothetical protein